MLLTSGNGPALTYAMNSSFLNRSRRMPVFHAAILALVAAWFPLSTRAANPYSLFHGLGRASLASTKSVAGGAFNANSLFRSQLCRTSLLTSSSSVLVGSSSCQRRMLVRRHVLDFFDPLEPLETAWEFYCNRYEILDELLVKLAAFAKRNSVKALTVMSAALVSAEALSRLGVFGKKGESLWQAVKESERFSEGIEERALQKTSSWMLDRSMGVLKQFRHFGGKSKFAISVSVGAIFGKGVIQLTTAVVKTVMISFFVLETMSFLGMIGEPGETIFDWIDDHRDESPVLIKSFARWHKGVRKRVNFDYLESLYEAAVDEEKLATFGFSIGTVVGLLT